MTAMTELDEAIFDLIKAARLNQGAPHVLGGIVTVRSDGTVSWDNHVSHAAHRIKKLFATDSTLPAA
jgi:hypothetical protein